jgi:hypothetical protein
VDAITAGNVLCTFISGVDNWMSFGNCIIGRQLSQKMKQNK